MTEPAFELLEDHAAFGGRQLRIAHSSATLACRMTCSVFLPPGADAGAPVPVLYWLSGLTCTDENFTHKAGAQRLAAELGLALVAPDTSPRGLDTPGADERWDLGTGASFYVTATAAPWAPHWNMHDYVIRELPALLEPAFGLDATRRAVSGHSMGGHGALVLSLRNPGHFASTSAFAPIASPMHCPWGERAFSAYLGSDRTTWRAWDACALMEDGADFGPHPVRVDQGEADGFLVEQLQPERLEAAATARGLALDLHRQAGYDHSYYFVASFIEPHLRQHAEALATAG
ncbi:MAG: S-formylglutathione hydrolase [Pseudomonadales bacterium]|nr:S-formylglutathione hydrolase [Pseudomonadales bacterium]